MRCVTSLQTCLALMLAFFVAPFQHVHTDVGADHDHSATIHAHFYSVSPAREKHPGRTVTDVDDHSAVRSVDLFTVVLTHGLAPFVPARLAVALFIPSVPIS